MAIEFFSIDYDDLKKADKNGALALLAQFTQNNNAPLTVPLAVNESGNDLITAKSLGRFFYAFSNLWTERQKEVITAKKQKAQADIKHYMEVSAKDTLVKKAEDDLKKAEDDLKKIPSLYCGIIRNVDKDGNAFFTASVRFCEEKEKMSYSLPKITDKKQSGDKTKEERQKERLESVESLNEVSLDEVKKTIKGTPTAEQNDDIDAIEITTLLLKEIVKVVSVSDEKIVELQKALLPVVKKELL